MFVFSKNLIKTTSRFVILIDAICYMLYAIWIVISNYKRDRKILEYNQVKKGVFSLSYDVDFNQV